MMYRATCILTVLFAIGGRCAWAQGQAIGRMEIGGGITWMGSASAGSSDATESTSSGGTSTLFKTSSTLGGAAGLRVHAAFRVINAVEIEGQASFSQPTLDTSVSNDIENAAAVTASETIKQYIIGGGALWYVAPAAPGRLRPFVAGQVAYLRQLHEGDTLAVTGRTYQIGGGVKYLVSRPGSRLKAYGVRGDVGVASRSKGVFFDTTTRVSPVAAASFFVRF